MSFSSDSVLEGNSECNPIPSSSASTWELSSFNFIPVLCLYVDRQHSCIWAGKEPATVRHERGTLIKSIVFEIFVKFIFR